MAKLLPWKWLGLLAALLSSSVMGQSVYTTPYTFTTLAGRPGTSGTNDGAGNLALFDNPVSVAVDTNGDIYVADLISSVIRQVSPAGTVRTVAGTGFFRGTNDGTGSAVKFDEPGGVAVDTNGNVYIADTGNTTIRKGTMVGSNLMVTTLVKINGHPAALAVDNATNIYLADDVNHTIREVSPSGSNWTVTTLAGLAGTSGTNDGTNGGARFDMPSGVALDTNGNVYVADTVNGTVRKLTPVGTNCVVTTIAGLALHAGSNDGTNNDARFLYPAGVTVDTQGTLYVTDRGTDMIRKITLQGTNWVVTTLAGSPSSDGTNDGTGSVAQFRFPMAVAVDTNGCLYVADDGNETIRKGYPPGSVPSPVIQPPGMSGGRFGFGINGLMDLAVDVQVSGDLNNWQTSGKNYLVLVNGTNFFSATNSLQSNQFFRLHVR